jgi:predicted signal transduction protein with EAL and GGDEF domain
MGDLQPVINASTGIAVYPGDGTSEEQLIRNADTAMYRAKKAGVGCVFFHALEIEGASARESFPRAASSG